jgi:hypothetical protein
MNEHGASQSQPREGEASDATTSDPYKNGTTMSGDDAKGIHEKLDALILSVNTLSTKFDAACSDLSELRTEIYGNGHDGLKRELHEHLVRHDERGRIWKILATLGGGTGLAGLLTSIFKS